MSLFDEVGQTSQKSAPSPSNPPLKVVQGDFFARRKTMTITCPHCRSSQVITKAHAEKLCSIVGALGGAASGITSCLTTDNIGPSQATVAGPIASALIAGVIGATSGCIIGAKLGHEIDTRILDNYRCLNCTHDFTPIPN